MAIAAILSAFIAISVYKKTLKDELAKKSDVKEVGGKLMEYKGFTDKKIDGHEVRILKIEENKASNMYVDQQDRALHHRINGIEKRLEEDIHEVRSMVTDIHQLMIKK